LGTISSIRLGTGETEMTKFEKTTGQPTNRSSKRNYDRFNEYSDRGQ
jgi:hypothetical protein